MNLTIQQRGVGNEYARTNTQTLAIVYTYVSMSCKLYSHYTQINACAPTRVVHQTCSYLRMHLHCNISNVQYVRFKIFVMDFVRNLLMELSL